MKKLIIGLLLIAGISSEAQITLEHTYPAGSVIKDYLRLVKLSSSGYKYAADNDSSLTLYNLNHTVFRTITFPPFSFGLLSSSSNVVHTYYISEELFNTNPNDIEYLLFYTDPHTMGHIIVYDETGNILFSKDTVTFGGSGVYLNEDFISYSTAGCKMIISHRYSGAAYVYSLPGFLPCHDCTNGETSSFVTDNGHPKEGSITNYPNPSSGQTTIEYELPQGTTIADLVFYDMTGREVKRYKVSNAFKDILISTDELAAGTYYYQLQTTSGFKAGKKMIVIK